ncbi:MAG: DUF429 domain-containing protein [Myxococcota bacterium]
MAVVIGAHPGGKSRYTVCGLFYSGSLPALMFRLRSYSGTDEVLGDIVGTFGEWGELAAVAIDAPLTWSGTASGWRACDLELKQKLDPWIPKTWVRPPNALAGAVGVQGPALAWTLAQEIKSGQLPKHTLVETNPRLCLARIATEKREAILQYRNSKASAAERNGAVHALLGLLVESGVVQLEDTPPRDTAQLDALVSALVALGTAHPESGLIVNSVEGGEIVPVGRRPFNLLTALP